jgi:hypothetical protein
MVPFGPLAGGRPRAKNPANRPGDRKYTFLNADNQNETRSGVCAVLNTGTSQGRVADALLVSAHPLAVNANNESLTRQWLSAQLEMASCLIALLGQQFLRQPTAQRATLQPTSYRQSSRKNQPWNCGEPLPASCVTTPDT